MASSMLPKSLQRTDSTGQLNVFILLKKKSNDDLLIVSREDLPPTLRNGRLVLNQKIIIRDEARNSIEGVIVYMHSDRDNCLAFKKQMIANKIQYMNETNGIASSSNSNRPLSSSAGINSKLPKNISKKPSVPPLLSTQKSAKSSSSNKQSVESRLKPSSEAEDQQENDDTNYNISSDVNDSSLPSITDLNEKNKTQTTFDSTFDASIIITDDTQNDVFIDKINQLSARVNQLTQMVKARDAELKRLQSTMIELPTDQVTRDYLCYQADKIRQKTTGHKYVGNLTKDANCLGIGVVQLKELLDSNGGITSIAREIFKRIIPEHKRSVHCWNDLSEEVILKEKLLIKFLEQYFGSLEVEPKKVHISLVGCLRNDRGKQKQKKQPAEVLLDNDKDPYHLDEINGVGDEDNY